MDIVLTVVEGPRAGLAFRAKGRTVVTIGRSKTTDFHILDGSMSRVHAVVAKDAQGWYVEDRKSRNGLWVGDQRVEKARLAPGTVFGLGRITTVRFEFFDDEMTRADVSVPVVVSCARCRGPVAPAELVRSAEGRPYHLACRDLEHLVGSEIGGYKVVERMDPLGDAFFFRAHQPTLNRTVTLEVFDPPLTARPGFRETLLEEVRRASRFLHPNVLQIYDFGEARGMCFVAMEHFAGAPLARVLQERRFVKIREAVTVALQVCEALQYAREQGAVLGWISPKAILVSADHDVKVRLLREPGLAPSGVHASDAAYVAPEVISSESKGQDPPAVVYSVAAVLYHMLAGIPPFEGDTTDELARRVQRESPPALRRINLKVSPALAQVVEGCLDRRPAGRLQSLSAMIEGLRSASAPAR